jgi:hypothetical protein
MLRHKGTPLIEAYAPTAPAAPHVTGYDEQRLPIYVRLLDANTAGAPWQEAADRVLGLDVDADPDAARQTWQSHLDRAKWMTEVGYRDLLD